MSTTRNFKIGHADVFQDKPSEETRLMLESMHRAEYEKACNLVDGAVHEIAELLKHKTEAELSIVLKAIVRRTNEYKTKK